VTLGGASDQDLHGIHSAIHEGLENGTLRPQIAVELPLAEAAEAHKQVMLSGKVGKIVLLPG
jgi:NADPH2:quinone reductase